jgi:hypothetical protein
MPGPPRPALAGLVMPWVHATCARLSEARLGDGLKAAEMLAKMCSWNEPETQRHEHIHLQVDANVMEQLRAGYSTLHARSMGEPRELPAAAVVVNSEPDGSAVDDVQDPAATDTEPEAPEEKTVTATEYANMAYKDDQFSRQWRAGARALGVRKLDGWGV